MNIKDENHVILKANIPSYLKIQFKIICVQKESTMSTEIEKLIRKWIQADTPIDNFVFDLFEEDYQNIKGYIPKSLKNQFKILCTQKGITMTLVLYNLIKNYLMDPCNS